MQGRQQGARVEKSLHFVCASGLCSKARLSELGNDLDRKLSKGELCRGSLRFRFRFELLRSLHLDAGRSNILRKQCQSVHVGGPVGTALDASPFKTLASLPGRFESARCLQYALPPLRDFVIPQK